MKKIINLFINTIKYFEAKALLYSIRNNKIQQLIFKIFSVFFLLNILIFIPLFFISNLIISLSILFFISITFFIIIFIKYKIKSISKEKLDKIIINNSIYKEDFINFLSNDIFFNLKISLIISFCLFFYQILIYTLLKFLHTKFEFIPYLISIISYFVFLTMVSYICFFIYYLKNRNSKSIFSRISSQSDFSNKYFTILLLFLLFFFPIFYFYKIFIFKFMLSIIFTIISSIFLSISMNLLFLKIGFYKRSNWIFFFNKIKNNSINVYTKINIKKIFNLFKSFKLLYPLLFALLLFLLLSILNNFFNFNIKIRFFFIYLVCNVFYISISKYVK